MLQYAIKRKNKQRIHITNWYTIYFPPTKHFIDTTLKPQNARRTVFVNTKIEIMLRNQRGSWQADTIVVLSTGVNSWTRKEG
jgi:hypothetical protein